MSGTVDSDFYGVFYGNDTFAGKNFEDVTQQGRQGRAFAAACRTGQKQDALILTGNFFKNSENIFRESELLQVCQLFFVIKQSDDRTLAVNSRKQRAAGL